MQKLEEPYLRVAIWPPLLYGQSRALKMLIFSFFFI